MYTSSIPAIEVEQLRDMLQSETPPVIIDVREKWENDLCQIPGNQLIPLGDLPAKLEELPKDQTIVMHCHHGGRSARATAYLMQQGFSKVYNLTGGIHAWSERIDPKVKIYQ
jgi:rhodanese-related sulfurtransferase